MGRGPDYHRHRGPPVHVREGGHRPHRGRRHRLQPRRPLRAHRLRPAHPHRHRARRRIRRRRGGRLRRAALLRRHPAGQQRPTSRAHIRSRRPRHEDEPDRHRPYRHRPVGPGRQVPRRPHPPAPGRPQGDPADIRSHPARRGGQHGRPRLARGLRRLRPAMPGDGLPRLQDPRLGERLRPPRDRHGPQGRRARRRQDGHDARPLQRPRHIRRCREGWPRLRRGRVLLVRGPLPRHGHVDLRTPQAAPRYSRPHC